GGRHQRQLPRRLAPPGRPGADPPLRQLEPVSRVDDGVLRGEAAVDSRRRRDAARQLPDPLRHEHGQLEPASALRCAAHPGWRRWRKARGQSSPRLRAENGYNWQLAAEPDGHVRRPSRIAGRQHRPARQALMRRFYIALFVFLLAAAGAAAESLVADAVMNRDVAALRALLQKKADVNAAQVDGSTALHWAVYHDNLQAADLLIASGANVKALTREGVTPLSMATLYGSVPMVERLLKAGADAKELGPNGETMLMFAARNGNPRLVQLFVAAGVDVNAAEKLRKTTALMWAAEQHHHEAVQA